MESYTKRGVQSFWDSDCEDYSAQDIKNYLDSEENFRDFSAGLYLLMEAHGYTGGIGHKDGAVKFLMDKCLAMPSVGAWPDRDIAALRRTLGNWFREECRPEILEGSRERIFLLCFALGCSLDEVNWFLAHVLFSRPFYCRNIRDAVYFYCFYHGYSYDHCRELLRQVQAIEGYADGGDPIDTQVICNKLQQIRPGDDVELLRFIQYNGGAFTSWETKAFAVLRHLLVHVKGKAEDVDQLKAYVKNHDYKTIDQAGYVVQDYARLHHNGKMEFANIHIDSIDFMLNMMLNVRKMDKRQLQFSVTPSICKLIQRNFPDRNGFYAIMKENTKSYELLRKAIILLQFYACRFTESEETEQISPDGHYDYFTTKINLALHEARMDTLFIGNPYDLIFMLAARNEDPVWMLQAILSKGE